MNEKTDASGAQVPCISLLEEASAILNRAYDVLMSDAKGAALIDALDPVAYDIERIKPRVAAALTILSSNPGLPVASGRMLAGVNYDNGRSERRSPTNKRGRTTRQRNAAACTAGVSRLLRLWTPPMCGEEICDL